MDDTKDIKGSFESFIGKESAGLRISICGLRIIFMIENQKGCILKIVQEENPQKLHQG